VLHREIMPTTWLLVAIILMAALRLLLPQPLIVPQPWHLVGLVPLALGVLINLVADGALRQAATTVKPYEEPSALIEGGAFRASRNPMYLGFVSILLGVAVLLRTAAPFVVLPAFAILMDRAYISVEERMLAERFGARWEAYRRCTRRWV
jgi:protein-S-isoprenylcysteine O-methyltransferase Ste14